GTASGILAALKHNSWIDTITMGLSLFGISMPIFWLALLFIFVFSITLRWFPSIGEQGPERLVLPAAALGLVSAAPLARLVRSSMLEVLSQEYVTAARAKGLAERVVILRHVLK